MTSSGAGEYSQVVTGHYNMSLAFEKTFAPLTSRPERHGPERSDERLNIAVVFTSIEATLPALRKAGVLANSLRARVTLLVPQVVPHPLPLETPPVLVEFNERRFRLIACKSPVETTVRIFLCRDRVARKLRRAGHEVILSATE
jgi:hypothetical protein